MPYQNISAHLTEQDRAEIHAALVMIEQKLPFLVNLTMEERRRLFKMGDKSLAFVSNSLTTAQQNPTMLPQSLDVPELQQDFELAHDLTEILVQLRQLTEKVDDTLVAVGSEAMQASLMVYDYAKAAAKHQPGLKSVADQLGERFKAIGESYRRNRRQRSGETDAG